MMTATSHTARHPGGGDETETTPLSLECHLIKPPPLGSGGGPGPMASLASCTAGRSLTGRPAWRARWEQLPNGKRTHPLTQLFLSQGMQPPDTSTGPCQGCSGRKGSLRTRPQSHATGAQGRTHSLWTRPQGHARGAQGRTHSLVHSGFTPRTRSPCGGQPHGPGFTLPCLK